MDNIHKILDPITPKKFFTEYWNKKHLVIRRNKFKNIFTWNHFDIYMNRFPRVSNLQVIDYDAKHEKWCLDKVRSGKVKLPMLKKADVYDYFKNKNKSIVIPFAEYENKHLVDLCFEFEKYFGKGTANIYISPSAKSKSYPAHADSTENFLFHTEGRVKWIIYEEFAPGKPKNILEIGTGNLALTRLIITKKPKKFIGVEIDKELRDVYLQNNILDNIIFIQDKFFMVC